MIRFELIFVSLVALFLGLMMVIVGVAFAISPAFSLPLRALSIFKLGPLYGGIVLAVVGFSLLLAFYSLNRKRFLKFKTAGYSVSEEVLADLAQRSLRQRYPNCVCDVVVKRGEKLEVTANVPAKEEELDQIEALLQEAFAESCGFKEPFKLNLSTP